MPGGSLTNLLAKDFLHWLLWPMLKMDDDCFDSQVELLTRRPVVSLPPCSVKLSSIAISISALREVCGCWTIRHSSPHQDRDETSLHAINDEQDPPRPYAGFCLSDTVSWGSTVGIR